jgi:hypothetical protein
MMGRRLAVRNKHIREWLPLGDRFCFVADGVASFKTGYGSLETENLAVYILRTWGEVVLRPYKFVRAFHYRAMSRSKFTFGRPGTRE